MSEFAFELDDVIKDTLKYSVDKMGFDKASIESFMKETFKISSDVLYPSWRESDTKGAKYVGGKVIAPYEESFIAMKNWGGFAIGLPEEANGMPMPNTLISGIHEIICAANFPFSMCGGLSRGAANVLFRHLGERGKDYVTKIAGGEWTGTMCLSEPQAGSAVGDIKTKATPQDDDTYLIEGQKIWITFGEHGYKDVEVVHLVLAKTPNAPSGTGGITLFAVPTVLDDGSRNGVACLGIEHKMGIHGSPTCTMGFGGDLGPCIGYRVGDEFAGMKLMFEMMIEARIGVGVQALAQLHGSYALAKRYAAERVQGVAIEDAKNDDAERVSIDNHPPVQRLLERNRVLLRAIRALVMLTSNLADKYEAEGDKNAEYFAQFCTPLVKGWASEYAFLGISECLQIFGGNGYLEEFPINQYLRDNRIALIYEGTNEIQALDLVGRQLPGKGGLKAMMAFQWISGIFDEAEKNDSLASATKQGRKLQNILSEVVMGLGSRSPREVTRNAVPLMCATGVLVSLAALLEMAPEDANVFAEEFVPEVLGRMHFLKG